MVRWFWLGVQVGVVGLCGCGIQLSAGGAAVRMGTASPAGAVCSDLGVVYGSAGGGDYASAEDKLQTAQNDLRNKTAALGGNFVVMDVATTDRIGMSISGHALSCSSGEPAVAAAPVATQFA